MLPFLWSIGDGGPPSVQQSGGTENKTIIHPVISHQQGTGKSRIIKVGLCELRQVVTFLYNFIGVIFLVFIFSLIFILKRRNKVVRIFFAYIVVVVVAPYEKRFLLGFT